MTMTNDGFMTAAEMKSILGLSAQSGDNRTLNKYVKEGKLEIKPFSRKVKLYREKTEFNTHAKTTADLDFCF